MTIGRTPETLSSVLRNGFAIGLTAGMAELVELAIRRWGLGELLYVSAHVLWIVPVTYGGLVTLVGAFWWVAHRAWPGLLPRVTGPILMSFIGWLCVLLVWHPRLHELAAVALAAGLAVQTGRRLARAPITARGLAAVGGLWAVALVASGGFLSRVLIERQPLQVAGAGRTNVIVIVWDTVRAISVGGEGRSRSTTPNLDRMARDGVDFRHAVAPAPWTLPSHASLFTGRWPHELSAGWKAPLDDRYPTLGEILGSEGYATAGFVANLIYGTRAHGLSRGFGRWEDYRISWGEVVLSTALGRFVANSAPVRRLLGYYDIFGRRSAQDITDAFLGWQATVDRPFFAFLNYFDAHEPYLPPAPFDTLVWRPELRRLDTVRLWNREGSLLGNGEHTPDQVRAELSAYEAAITYLDSELGRLVDSLDARGVLARTLVVVTSDHGEQFGERGVFTHGNSLYPEATDVPLVLFSGGVPAGVTVNPPVSLRDAGATILSLVAPSRAGDLSGGTLRDLWTPESPARRRVALSELDGDGVSDVWGGAVTSIVTDSHLLIGNGDGSSELYPIVDHDLGEEIMITDAPSLRSDLEGLRDSILAQAPDPRVSP